ncbi:MAG: Gfo/Idh/MocA family oxidoreductase [Victivallaceae bacterium]|nr:Gfo/Idh/MocA family oxidoreductase [Victivallaceae bacterium]
MKKIGFIDLDTSHPRSFVKRINAMNDFQVTGVFDRGRAKGKTETTAFCKEFDVKEYDSAAALAVECDGVMVLSADWETHLEDITAILQAGKACYCDKPLVTSLDELDRFVALCEQSSAPMFAGSGWRWNAKTAALATEIKAARISDAIFCVPSDRYYYGIHGVEWILGLFGSGIEAVKAEINTDDATIVSLYHQRGMAIRLVLETDFPLSRFNVFAADGEDHSLALDGDDIHDGICGNFTQAITTGKSPATVAELTEAVRIMFAIEESLITGKSANPKALEQVSSIPSIAFMADYCK